MKKLFKSLCSIGRNCGMLKKFILYLMLSMMMVPNAGAKIQTGKLDVSYKNLSLKNVINDLETRTRLSYLYDEYEIKKYDGITYEAKGMPLEEILANILLKTSLDYSIDENIVVIKESSLKVKEKEDKKKQEIRGKVLDKEGNPIPGVAVVVKGTNTGTATDINGDFNIKVNKDDIIVVSFLGMQTQEFAYTDKFLKIILKEEKKKLEEVFVIGYGVAKKKDLTGSVSRMGKEQLKSVPMNSSVEGALQGRAAGVNVMVSSASPTSPVSVIIRGASSLTGDCQPLWIIDGVPQYNNSLSGNVTNSLYNLNLNDVESIDVLKDASATAIYGSRAANGVIIVTTRKNTGERKPTIELTTRYGIQHMDNNGFDVLNGKEYIELSKNACRMGVFAVGGLDYFTRKYIDKEKFNALMTSEIDLHTVTDDMFREDCYFSGNTDWMDLMTKDAASHEINLSMMGGTQVTNYYASFFTKQQDGIVKGGDSKTYGGRLNFETNVGESLKFNLDINGSMRQTNIKDNMISKILGMRPDYPPYNEDGEINKIDYYTENPLVTALNRDQSEGKLFTGTLGVEWKILKDLKLKTGGTVNYSHSKNDIFNIVGYPGDINNRKISERENYTYLWENTLSYFNKTGKHEINGLLGFSTEKHENEGFSANGSMFPDDNVLIDLGSGAGRPVISSSISTNTLVSSFARLNYKFKDRYLFTGTFRIDGSSRFGSDKRWGYFPSGALAWIVTEEPFMEDFKYIFSYIKLRLSAGKTGSQNLGDYDFMDYMGSNTYNGNPALVPSSMGNPALQWESQTQVDLGLDYGLFDDKIRGSIGVYQKDIDNLIYTQPVPSSSSFSQVYQNIGSIRNKGIEFDVTADIIRNNTMTWDVSFNIAHNVGTLEKLNNTDEFFGGSNYNNFKIYVGDKLGEFYGMKTYNRLFQTMEEIYALRPINPDTGIQGYYYNSTEGKGDLYRKDLNGDSKVDFDDREPLGNSNPDFFGGFNSNLYWKGFHFGAQFTYAYGAKRLWNEEMEIAGDINVYNRNRKVLQSWTMNPGVNNFPRMTYYGRGSNDIFCDYYLHDASYLRLSSLNVAYRLPEKLFNSTIVKNIEFKFQATNLFTITDYPGMDPQGNFSTSNVAFYGAGVDSSTYPPAKTFNISMKIILQ